MSYAAVAGRAEKFSNAKSSAPEKMWIAPMSICNPVKMAMPKLLPL
jgi:hypothetical protein